MAKKIPFKISARTARLIGRQNFPNPEGAIIELVKNSYDADANTCIVIFDNKYSEIPQSLTITEYNELSGESKLISEFFTINQGNNSYDYSNTSRDNGESRLQEKTEQLLKLFQTKCQIHIIDNGEGMTNEIIEKFWMTIGTQNKKEEYITQRGRIKTGEKGIGRFALDKLGDKAEMLTAPDPKVYTEIAANTSYFWEVNWSDFEGEAKTLDQIDANLIDLHDNNFFESIIGLLPNTAISQDAIDSENGNGFTSAEFQTGTVITIKNPRNLWSDNVIKKLFRNLEVLIPPREESIFNLFLFSTLNPKKYGKILPSICDDYDYKVVAKAGIDGKVTIEIFRNEFDIIDLPDDFFERELFSRKNFLRSDFKKKSIKVTRTIEQLAKGLKDVDAKGVLENLGSFGFTLYFMKASASRKDREVFHYKEFNAASRRAWFSQFGGIKLFRDNFRVRPYGEIDNPAFDWLQLGERATRSPSSIGQKDRGDWRVRPNQISGIIDISRVTNINFEDTSSRYGLQENSAFSYFSEIIKGLIGVFENDRSIIGRELRDYYEETHEDERKEGEAAEAKERVKKKRNKKQKTQEDEDAEILLEYSEALEEQLEELRDEGRLLRILASNGLVIASFTHELRGIEDKLDDRISEVKDYLQPVIDLEKISSLEEYKNPLIMLDEIEQQDRKLREWLYYSLETLKKDKRKRDAINLIEYFKDYKDNWKLACESRGVELMINLPDIEELKIRFFEGELDSILNNILINSMDAFKRPGAPVEREINITLSIQDTDIKIDYIDSGPGLSEDILIPDSIFEPFVTTKRDPLTGQETGYGLGMWIVKMFVRDNNGEVKILDISKGFGLSIIFFGKYHG
jgi:signal transduction histidine kinase